MRDRIGSLDQVRNELPGSDIWRQASSGTPACRACGGRNGQLVLDAGDQPACDYFPRQSDPGPDPLYALQMWLCADCGLAQIVADPTIPEEPRGAEPAALREQASDAVSRVSAAGWLPAGRRVAEYGSPHGGSWLGLLADQGLIPVSDDEQAEVIVDCFGMMHAVDQSAALAERAARLAPGGVLLLQYHSLATIVRQGQWNALRHGHYAYYSTTALVAMLAAAGLSPRAAWQFDLYGGTVLLAATATADGPESPDHSVPELLTAEACLKVNDPAVVARLQRQAEAQASRLHEWLDAGRVAGQTVLGYGAASRAVALLVKAGVDRTLLAAVADASPAKQGRRMPGTQIPIVRPDEIVARRPRKVLLFLPDLLMEVRAAFPEIEAAGGEWVDVELLVSDLA
jgi:hypothetical protein